MTVDIRVGDCREVLSTLDAESMQCCVTSPPYFGLRDYGVEGQLGLERTPDEYVERLTAALREVRRVLRDDGTLWLNLGDSYTGSGKGGNPDDSPHKRSNAGSMSVVGNTAREAANTRGAGDDRCFGLAPKNLIGIPWRVAFALQADGWYLRSDIIWHKPNPMPESVTDRPTKAHEYLFLLAKSERYFYDADAIAEPTVGAEHANDFVRPERISLGAGSSRPYQSSGTRNKRSVWSVSTQPYSGAHFATFPPALIEPCILAGSRVGDTVLDPFGGAGTTGLVCDRLSRNALLIELNPQYAEMARKRLVDDAPLFAKVAL